MAIVLEKLVSVDGGNTFVHAATPPGPVLVAPTDPVFRFVVSNTGDRTLTLVSVTDSVLGPIIVGGTLAPGASLTAQVPGSFAPGEQCNSATATANENGAPVSDSDSACYFGAEAPGISVEKLVSVDGGITFVVAGSPPGPGLIAPTNPQFRYVVTNSGDVTLHNVTLIDSFLGLIALPTTSLAPGAWVQVTASGTFAAGAQCNLATATGTFDGHSVSDQQAACYTGFSGAAINLEKLVSVDGGTTFADADAPPGPTLIFPATPLFRYRVTNTGTVTLNNIALADTDLGSITIPTTTLAPGASFQVTVPGAFAPGQQTNTATVTGQANGETVTNSDAANYFGVAEASILVQKRVSVNNGATFVNADTPPGPALFAPTNPQFRFIVTNNGSFTLNNVALSDTTFGPIALPTSTLTAGQSVVVTLPGTFVAGQHCNLATATGEADGLTVTDTDQACFRGVTGPLPEFPDISDPAPQDQIIDRLLETIALEELALAALINAEAEKVQAVAAAGILGPVDAEQLTAVNLAVADVIRLAGVKEEHLRRKLLRLLAHKERGTGSPAP